MDRKRDNKVPQKLIVLYDRSTQLIVMCNAKNREIKMQPNFVSSKRQKFNAAKIVCLTLYKPTTLNSKVCTVSLF